MYRLRVDERGQFEVQFREAVALCYRWRRNSVGSALFTYPFANETTSLSCLHRSVSKHKVFLLQRLCYKKYIYKINFFLKQKLIIVKFVMEENV